MVVKNNILAAPCRYKARSEAIFNLVGQNYDGEGRKSGSRNITEKQERSKANNLLKIENLAGEMMTFCLKSIVLICNYTGIIYEISPAATSIVIKQAPICKELKIF